MTDVPQGKSSIQERSKDSVISMRSLLTLLLWRNMNCTQETHRLLAQLSSELAQSSGCGEASSAEKDGTAYSPVLTPSPGGLEWQEWTVGRAGGRGQVWRSKWMRKEARSAL